MNTQEVLATFRKLGKPQTAAIYRRHGSGDDVFGVLTSEIEKLRKKIRLDDALAAELWETGNAEARILAIQITDPAKLSRAHANRLLKAEQVHCLAVYIAPLVARSRIADETMRSWMDSPHEHAREVGYGILSARLKGDADSVSDADARRFLETIEKEIHQSPNWARYEMNNALIAIGCFKPELAQQAIAAAERIGDISIDHGETTCKTPAATSYIRKTLERRRARKSAAVSR